MHLVIELSKLLVSQRGHLPTHPVDADASLGGRLILLQHAHPRGGGVCVEFFFVSKILMNQRGHPPIHPIGADTPLGGGLILLQHAHPRGGDDCGEFDFYVQDRCEPMGPPSKPPRQCRRTLGGWADSATTCASLQRGCVRGV
jgi:hypothetical protein